jgi:4-diphosphocytidyl-2C-methyl-D-erythritol kinase
MKYINFVLHVFSKNDEYHNIVSLILVLFTSLEGEITGFWRKIEKKKKSLIFFERILYRE